MTRPATLVLTFILSAGCATHSGPADLEPVPATADDERRARKSFVIPALEIIAMDGLVNLGGRTFMDPAEYAVSLTSIRRNLRSTWVVDEDVFAINQFLHPYQGAMYHGIARSTGHNYWTSVAYTFIGSALWEIAGETTAPAKNDQIASGIAGSFLGEPMFRVARMVLDRNRGNPGFWRTLGATFISPPAGINRGLFGDSFDRPESDVLAASDIRLQLGVTADLRGRTPSLSTLKADTPSLGFSVEYGFPGDPKYSHTRSFDYFRIDGLVSSEALARLTSRGLVAGKDFSAGHSRGVWGVYGGYEYFEPDVFRLSSTSLSFGMTTQSWLSDALALQSTLLIGAGYTAAHAADREKDDYHYGVAPQALGGLRVIAGRRAAIDLTAREYFISDVAGFGTRQRDRILVGDASVAVRIGWQHAVAVTYLISQRDARHPDLPRLRQSRSTLGLFYTFLGSSGFGAVR